jgi:glycerophosphoryl diester phosphodiesterase
VIFETFERTLIIAHRGRTLGGAPDNTMKAFEQSVNAGAEMLEFDVRRTKDGVLVLHHDPTVVGKRLADITYLELLKQPGRADVPTLSELVTWARGKVMLDMELKEAGYEAEALEQVLTSFSPNKFIVTSYDVAALRAAKAAAHDVSMGLLTGVGGWYNFLQNIRDLLFIVSRLRRANADFVVCHVQLARAGMLNRAVKAGYSALIWGAKQTLADQEVVNDKRIFGLITDEPSLALQARTQSFTKKTY